MVWFSLYHDYFIPKAKHFVFPILIILPSDFVSVWTLCYSDVAATLQYGLHLKLDIALQNLVYGPARICVFHIK